LERSDADLQENANIGGDRRVAFASLKLDSEKLDQCAAGLGREAVEQDVEDGRKLGVSATPTFVVGTVKNDLMEARVRLSGVVAQAVLTKALRQLPRGR
jgi:protein-disulfide isomerase